MGLYTPILVLGGIATMFAVVSVVIALVIDGLLLIGGLLSALAFVLNNDGVIVLVFFS